MEVVFSNREIAEGLTSRFILNETWSRFDCYVIVYSDTYLSYILEKRSSNCFGNLIDFKFIDSEYISSSLEDQIAYIELLLEEWK